MNILGLDPGTRETGWYILEKGRLALHNVAENASICCMIVKTGLPSIGLVACEWLQCYSGGKREKRGPLIGQETLLTAMWIGRFCEAAIQNGTAFEAYLPPDIRGHVAANRQADESAVRWALIDRFGGEQEVRKGGKLYKVAGHQWPALAVACAAWDVYQGLPGLKLVPCWKYGNGDDNGKTDTVVAGSQGL